MRNHYKRTKLLIGTFICIFTILMTATIVLAANGHFFAEPEKRPDISKNAIWDSELGMYTNGDYEKDSNGNLILKEEAADEIGSEDPASPEQQWISQHNDSKDPIDLAIMKSIRLASEKKPSILSSIQVSDSEEIQEAIGDLTLDQLPELWRRACEEPAFRPLKLAAIEKLLGISFDLGLYDKNSQNSWYHNFNALKKELYQGTYQYHKDYSKYGLLALPVLTEGIEGGKNDSLQITKDILINNDIVSPSSDTELQEWIEVNISYVNDISTVIDTDYEWVEP
jgi:hypothetical protein